MIKITDNIKIYEISYKKFKSLIDKWSNHENIDRLLFLSKNKNQYLVIDNEADECFVEEFDSKDKALCWLVRKEYDSDEIKKLQDDEIRKLISEEKYKIILDYKEVSYGL